VHASDEVYQLLVHGRWFSPGTPASPTTKTGRHAIAKILLKVALNSNQNANNDNIHIITRQSKTSVCLSKVMINMNTLLSVIIPYFQISLLLFSFLLLFWGTVADFGYPA